MSTSTPPSGSKSLTTRTSTSTDVTMPPPPPPTKRIKRPPTALPEDTYTSALSHIIARDFFPGLLETRTKQDYLDALDSGDREWLQSATSRLEAVMTPREDGRSRGRRGVSMTPTVAWATPRTPRTPLGGAAPSDTPMSSAFSTASTTDDAETKEEAEAEVNRNLSLDAFHTKYTSEDNESFYKVLDRQNAKRTEKYRWLWGTGPSANQIPSKRQILHRACEEQRLLSSGSSSSTALSRRDDDSDKRKAAPEAWSLPSGPNNHLMFAPDGIEDTHLQTTAQAREEKSKAPPKAVRHANTRLPAPPPPPEAAVPPSPSMSAVQDALAGRRHRGALDAMADDEDEDDGGETPRVNGYAFVDDEPTPSELGIAPSSALSADALLLLGSTGGASEGGKSPFEIKESSRREELHRRMVERVARGNRASPALSASSLRGTPVRVNATPVPKFTSSPRFTAMGKKERLRGGLTPAQERLWSTVRQSSSLRKGAGTPGGGSVFGDEAGGGVRASGKGKMREWEGAGNGKGGVTPKLTPRAGVQHGRVEK